MTIQQMKNKTHRLMSDQDMFGHTINLNFDKQGDSHQTFIGGIISIVVKILMFIYIGIKFDKLIYREGSSTAVAALLVKYAAPLSFNS